MLLHINYLDCEMYGLVAWKAELPKKVSHKEGAMKKRKGVRKKMVIILAEGNHLIAGNFPRHQGDGGSLPPVLLSHNSSKSSKKVMGEKTCVQPHHVLFSISFPQLARSMQNFVTLLSLPPHTPSSTPELPYQEQLVFAN